MQTASTGAKKYTIVYDMVGRYWSMDGVTEAVWATPEELDERLANMESYRYSNILVLVES